MTETGMLLSNNYRGERKAGFVGYPLPGVSTKLRDDGESPLLERHWMEGATTLGSPDLWQSLWCAEAQRRQMQDLIL